MIYPNQTSVETGQRIPYLDPPSCPEKRIMTNKNHATRSIRQTGQVVARSVTKGSTERKRKKPKKSSVQHNTPSFVSGSAKTEVSVISFSDEEDGDTIEQELYRILDALECDTEFLHIQEEEQNKAEPELLDVNKKTNPLPEGNNLENQLHSIGLDMGET